MHSLDNSGLGGTKMKPNKVLIAIPNIGNIRSELAEFLLRIRGDSNVVVHFSHARPITSNRNIIVKKFMETDCEYLLMIDSDVVPPLNILDMRNNKKEICGAYVCTNKGQNIIPLLMQLEDNKEYSIKNIKKNSLNEVDATGTGCLMIHRSVFEKMQKPYFEVFFDEEGIQKEGSDFYFCRKAKEKEIKIYVDTRFAAVHYQTFPLL